MSTRRLPIYLLLDTSESMAGPAIESVGAGLKAMLTSLRSNPHALEAVYMSVIEFSRTARVLEPLTELATFQMPSLKIRPGTSLGAGLRLLCDQMRSEVVKTTVDRKGDYRPLVFLLTDGQPTDDWQESVQILRSLSFPKLANFYAIGCGPDADLSVLGKITDIVLKMDELTPEAFKKLFVWLTASVQTASVSVGERGDLDSIDITKLPDGVLEKVDVRHVSGPERVNQVFLHARCQKDRRPYLMRHIWNDEVGRYVAVAAHALEDEDGEDIRSLLPDISTSLLVGIAPCPYCWNQNVGVCGCGTIFCASSEDNVVICPGCGAELTKSKEERNSLNLSQSVG